MVVVLALIAIGVFVLVVVLLNRDSKKNKLEPSTPILDDDKFEKYSLCVRFIACHNMTVKTSIEERNVVNDFLPTINYDKKWESYDSIPTVLTNKICRILARREFQPDLIVTDNIVQKVSDAYVKTSSLIPGVSYSYSISDKSLMGYMKEYMKEIDRVYSGFTKAERQILRTYK